MRHFIRTAAAACAVGGTLLAVPPALAVDNVADNGVPSITLNGVFGTLSPPVAAAWSVPPPVFSPPHTLVDGVFRGMFTTWTQQTVFWDASVPGASANSIVVNLDQAYHINQLLLEGDGNDVYQVQYRSGGSWLNAWFADPVPLFGLQTRASMTFAPITTDALRILGVGGDGLYALSEIQAFGVAAVPEPGTWAMLIAGLGLIAFVARRRLR